MSSEREPVPHFIRNIIEDDLKSGKHQTIVTRFPPEPNGYLHVGHAKSICLNFGLALDFKGKCNLRFDDTNPEKESEEYALSIQEDVRWLGFQWDGEVRWASDYFDALYGYAVELIQAGKAYVCDLTPDEMREYRGTLTAPGRNSPFRERPAAENLDLFARMKEGEFPDGSKVLRAKIDMASPNINMRDPAIYRIRRAHHIRTGDKWCIYPMYDYTHCISDALEGITHSLCTLEFEDHRPLYDWVLDNITIPCHPRQYEFSRLELQYAITSKRKLNQLVSEKRVSGWDDPRMPTIAGMRRRGYTPAGIREFARRIGISKSDNVIDMAVLEGCIREDMETSVPRVMAVVKPLKVVLTNFVAGETQSREAGFHPNHPEFGSREVPIAREIWIEADDFSEAPPPGWQRLVPGGEVRLRYSYVIRCDEVIRDATGNVIELHCSLDPETLGKNPQGRKVKGVIHWVSAEHALAAEIRLYDRLFTVARPDTDKERDFHAFLNPDSLAVVQGWIEPCVRDSAPETRYQFERLGYYCTDRHDHRPGEKWVFNRTVALKDTWAA
jgi:glutaminyl-tRNA synthetase